MRWIATILFLISTKLFAAGSDTISFLIIDSATLLPLEGVLIRDYGNHKRYVFTDSSGKGQLIWKDSVYNTKLVFSVLGYERMEMILVQNESPKQSIAIKLTPADYGPKKKWKRKKGYIDYIGE